MLYSHRRHGPPFTDGVIELDRVLGSAWLLRRVYIHRVIQDQRLTHDIVGRAASRTRACLAIHLSGHVRFFVDGRDLVLSVGEAFVTPPDIDPLARLAEVTSLEIEWEPGALGAVANVRPEKRALRQETMRAAADVVAVLREARPHARANLAVAVRRLFEQLHEDGISLDLERALRDIDEVATPEDQRLCDEIDRVLTHLEEGPQTIALEDALGCSRRTLLRRTQALCKRYLLPGLAADDWRTMRDTYRVVVGAIFATHPDITTRTLAEMLGYSSSEALCHAFANSGLPSPAALRNAWGGSFDQS